jgi:hypothetical protein
MDSFSATSEQAFADCRPPSRGAVTLYKNKLRDQICAAVPLEMIESLDEPPSNVIPNVEVVAMPENVMIPSSTRNPEGAYSPKGVQRVVRVTLARRPPPPTFYVRQLQKQTIIEAPERAKEDLQAKNVLRPRSVDVVSGGGPRVEAGCHVVHEPPTRATSGARERVQRAREFLEVQVAASLSATKSFTFDRSLASSAFGSQPAADSKLLAHRNGVVKKIHNQ